MQDYGYYIKPKNGSLLLFDSKNVRHGTVASSGFLQIGVSLLTKKSILDSFEELQQKWMRLGEPKRTKTNIFMIKF